MVLFCCYEILPAKLLHSLGKNRMKFFIESCDFFCLTFNLLGGRLWMKVIGGAETNFSANILRTLKNGNLD